MTSGRALLYLSSVSAIGLGVRSVTKGAVPIEATMAAITAFGGVILSGVFDPRLGMFIDVINRGEKKPDAPRLALTFDDGPSATTTPAILELLDEAGAKATFFVIGKKLEGAGGAIARRAHENGHAIACHSFGHDRLFALRGEQRVREDLRRALATIEDAVGAPTKLFRPPIGHTNPTIARVVDELDLTTIGFSVRAYDGTASAKRVRVERRVVAGLEDGAIALLHDAAEREDFPPTSLAALPNILVAMKERGLRGVTVDELLREDEPS